MLTWINNYNILSQDTKGKQRKGRIDNLFNSDLSKCERFLEIILFLLAYIPYGPYMQNRNLYKKTSIPLNILKKKKRTLH